ncbi:MAG: hypothetical protein JW779_04955 [Candidatus Thorarchaeota archaeon]|nr:hypothetical protein [Candidatus Thorarchaeota archaeon]
MSQVFQKNKFVISSFVIVIVIGGMTFGNMSTPSTPTGIQVIAGTTFNFADYPALTHEQIAIINYFDRLVTGQAYNLWDGWHAENYLWALQYINAFLAYPFAGFCETTSGYRTAFYEDFAYSQIRRMNTTIAEYGNDSMEYYEWVSIPGFVDYYFPNATHPDGNDVYTGGFRGPANIMWTGHYALMLALYERNFNFGTMESELSSYIVDWENSTTTDRLGSPKPGGLWGTGLIPCEPYVVFAQCNSIPIYTTELYDNMYGTTYMESGMWDYGLDFIEANITDEYGLYTNGYFVQKPVGWGPNSGLLPQEIPGQAADHLAGGPSLSSYGTAWALTFLEYTIPDITTPKYSTFLDFYGRDISGDTMYMLGSYKHPSSFGDIFGILGTVFTMVLANQRGDYHTRDRLSNLLQNMVNKVWSQDGRELYYDGSSLDPFLSPVLSGFSVWSTLPVTVRDLADARPAEFWDYPFISAADDDNIWVYQAHWDPIKSGFILNIRVDDTAELMFSNFNEIATVYSGGVSIGNLVPVGSDYSLTLQPGTYQLIIMEGT